MQKNTKKGTVSAISRLMIVILLIGIVSAHGVHGHAQEVPIVIISNENTYEVAKSAVEGIGLEIHIHKFTTVEEVEQELYHALFEMGEQVLIIAFEDTAKDFLLKNPEISPDRLIITLPEEDAIKNGMILLLANIRHTHADEHMGFAVPLTIGLLIGAICGLGGGVYYGKRR